MISNSTTLGDGVLFFGFAAFLLVVLERVARLVGFSLVSLGANRKGYLNRSWSWQSIDKYMDIGYKVDNIKSMGLY